MTRPGAPFPRRLRAEGGTPLEQRLLNAAARQEPSRELTERMAKAVGVVAPTALPNPAPAPELGAGAAGTGTLAPKAAASSSALLPWISGAVIVAVAGFFVATRSSKPIPRAPQATSAATASSLTAPIATEPAVAPSVVTAPESVASSTPPSSGAIRARSDTGDATNNAIAEQIALVDAASSAVSSGAGERALSLVREYQNKYPAGSFRPEVSALRIEALMLLGRRDEARAAAERFVTQHKGPLADRVARVAGSKP